MNTKQIHKTIHDFFEAGIIIKGLQALIETLSGIAFFFVSPALLLQIATVLTQDELSENPHDFIANYLLHSAQSYSVGTQLFAALYLISHGIVKLFLAGALLKNKMWAYPLSIVVFGLFILYQLYRLSISYSLGLIVLTVFDLAVIWLIWQEYQNKQNTM